MNFDVMKHCWDSIELPEIIPHNIGVGLEFSDELGNTFRGVLEHLESKRRILPCYTNNKFAGLLRGQYIIVL